MVLALPCQWAQTMPSQCIRRELDTTVRAALQLYAANACPVLAHSLLMRLSSHLRCSRPPGDRTIHASRSRILTDKQLHRMHAVAHSQIRMYAWLGCHVHCDALTPASLAAPKALK